METLIETRIVESSPAVVKLYGEHAVVAGSPSAGLPISIFATSECRINSSDMLEINLPDIKKSKVFSEGELKSIFKAFLGMPITDFIEKYEKSGISIELLSFATIASHMQDLGIRVTSRSLTVKSEIPIQRGLGSSAACNSAFAKALLKSSGKELPDYLMAELIRDGERVAHKNKNGGLIDAYTTYYSGLILVKGTKVENISADLSHAKILLVDTGPKLPTYITVAKFGNFIKNDNRSKEVLKKIEESVIEGVKALENGDLEKAGEYMYLDQEMLKVSGVSSDALDMAVSIAKNNKALGAKLSGGGGGGVAIVLLRDTYDDKKLISDLEKGGFKVSVSKPYNKEQIVLKADKQRSMV